MQSVNFPFVHFFFFFFFIFKQISKLEFMVCNVLIKDIFFSFFVFFFVVVVVVVV